MKHYINAFRNIFNYKGESTVSEFWTFFIINMIVNIIIRLIVRKFALPEYVHNIYIVIAILALISIGFKRMKNAGYSGWLFFIPIANLILALLPQKEVKEL